MTQFTWFNLSSQFSCINVYSVRPTTVDSHANNTTACYGVKLVNSVH